MSLGSLTVAAMDGVFEVMLEVHLAAGGDVPAPRWLPPGVRGHWDELSASVRVEVTAAKAPGVTVRAHAPSDAERAEAEQARAAWMEKLTDATPAQRAWAERESARLFSADGGDRAGTPRAAAAPRPGVAPPGTGG
jgi:hypothetical protein